MKASEKKTILSHMKKDDKEFRGQIKDDMELKSKLLGKKKKKKKEKEESKKHEMKEKRRGER